MKWPKLSRAARYIGSNTTCTRHSNPLPAACLLPSLKTVMRITYQLPSALCSLKASQNADSDLMMHKLCTQFLTQFQCLCLFLFLLLFLSLCQDGKVPDLSVGNSSCNNIADSQIPVLCDIDYGSCGKTNQLKAALAVVLLFQRSLTKRPFTPIAH